MKRIIIFTYLFIAPFSSSCVWKTPDTDAGYTENDIYAKINDTIYRFNVESGAAPLS